MLNFVALRTETSKVRDQIRAVKETLRETGQLRVTWHTYSSLSEFRHRATLLCAVRAHHRGKVHLARKQTLAQQKEMIESCWEEFQLAEESAATNTSLSVG